MDTEKIFVIALAIVLISLMGCTTAFKIYELYLSNLCGVAG